MEIPSIADFSAGANDPGRYARLSGDWWIASADVQGSTQLAAQGRDRDVNFIAGAVVAALGATVGRPGEPPACQFGGDGALAAVPPDRHDACAAVLKALAHWADTEFAIALRVGMVPVRALEEAGLEVMAALNDFGNGNTFGLFLGSGVAAAESWVKDDLRWRLAPAPGPIPGLEGLSCRWRPVPSQRGVVLCVIADAVDPGPSGTAALARLLARIEQVVPTADAAPMGDGEALIPGLLPPWASLWRELRATPKGRRLNRFVRALAGFLVIGAVHRLGGRLGRLDTAVYRRSTATRTDYRKQAGGPRLVLDLTAQEADRIEAILAEAEREGRIRYGTARSDATTMTCLVGDFSADRHVHFVDGGGLGFWRASVVLKNKKAKAAV